jgi:hypothetical protein
LFVKNTSFSGIQPLSYNLREHFCICKTYMEN